MPVTNLTSTTNNNGKGKYGLFICDTFGGTYRLFRRCIIQNFRTQLRGLGSCGVTIVPKDQINENVNEELKAGQFVKILDTSIYTQNEYTSVGDELFIGTVKSVTYDIYENKVDEKGYAQIDEIGHHYSKIPIIWYSKAQVFNPIVGGIAYGNKKPDESNFETNLASMATVKYDGETTPKFQNTTTNVIGNKRVWSLKDYLTYMAALHNVDVSFPWEFDNDILRKKANKDKEGLDPDNEQDQQTIQQIDNNLTEKVQANEKAYKIFTDTNEVKSYDHFDGKSFQELLQTVIEEPFDWYIYTISTNNPTFQIVNKSPIKIENYYPAAQLISKKIDKDISTNLNITKEDEEYDKLIYRGGPILVAGSMTNWNHNNAASYVQSWTDVEEQAYEKANDESDVSIAGSIRSKDKKVYQQYKYKHLTNDCPIQLPKKLVKTGLLTQFKQAAFYPTTDGSEHYDMVPFFPGIEFYTTNNNGVVSVLDTPKISNNPLHHKTPPLLEISWSETLPWKLSDNKEMHKPFICASSVYQNFIGGGYVYTVYDLTKSGGGYETVKFKHTVDGYQLELNYPETLASRSFEEVLFQCQTSFPDRPTIEYWDENSVSNRNPKAAQQDYKFFTHWKMLTTTVAGFSDQRLEYIINNPSTTNNGKTKIIEDESLQAWFVHGGTIKDISTTSNLGVGSDTGRNYRMGLKRFDNDTFVRNDFKKLYELANQASQWLFTKKSSIKLDLSLMLYKGGAWNLGEVIYDLIDKDISRRINTVVASVEYDCVQNRVYISTDMPSMPAMKKLGQTPISKSVISPSTDHKAATIEVREKIIEKKEYPEHGYVSGSGGGGSTPVYFISVGDGNELQTIGATTYKGIKRPADEIQTVPVSAAVMGASYPDGLSAAYLNNDSNAVVWCGLRLRPDKWVTIPPSTTPVLTAGTRLYDDYQGSLPEATPVICKQYAMVPIQGMSGQSAKVYVPWAL